VTRLTKSQEAVLLHAHNRADGQTFGGDQYAPYQYVRHASLKALAAAGLVTLRYDTRTVHTTPDWGRSRASRQVTSVHARVTGAGRDAAYALGGLLKTECDVSDCGDLVRVPQKRCAYHVQNPG
jgi:hypothetical protein